MSQNNPATTVLYVAATHNPLAFFYVGSTPTITINGTSHRLPWGTHKFDVSPGAYEVSVSYPWQFSSECGKNTARLELQAGQSKTVTYRAGLIRYLSGSIKVT